MPRFRSAVLGAVVVAAAALIGLPGGSAVADPVYAAPTDPIKNLADLRRAVEQVRAELETATADYERHRDQVRDLDRRLELTRHGLERAEAAFTRIQPQVARQANLAYQLPDGGMLEVIMSDVPDRDQRAAADWFFVIESRSEIVAAAADVREHQLRLARTAAELAERAESEKRRLAAEVKRLRQRSAAASKALVAAVRRIGPRAFRDQRVGLALCEAEREEQAKQYPNGFIPTAYLCPLPTAGQYLRPVAARAFYAMNRAYQKHFGVPMCITSSYRTYAEEAQIYQQTPWLGAVPGTSKHGLGTAVDLCGGIDQSGSVQYNWMEANARRFKFFHPSWAYSNPFEPWHWEYGSERAD